MEIYTNQVENVKSYLKNKKNTYYKIIDGCRKDNLGIFELDQFLTLHSNVNYKFSCFIPAAGAATRYFAPLKEIIANNLAHPNVKQLLIDYLKEQNLVWLFEDLQNISLTALKDLMDRPKALQVCAENGDSFLEYQLKELRQLDNCEALNFIIPEGYDESFAEFKTNDVMFLHQDKELSTPRVLSNGELLRDDAGELVLTPAGHGMTSKLISRVKETQPDVKSIFIKNIDNISADLNQFKAATELLIQNHNNLLKIIIDCRANLNNNEPLPSSAALLLKSLPQNDLTALLGLDKFPDVLQGYIELALRLFHVDISKFSDLKSVLTIFMRPLNCLGQVEKVNNDIGGSPCFVQHPQDSNVTLKLCIELPHVSEVDKDKYLKSERSTHFNPAFLMAEIPQSDDYYAAGRDIYWQIAQKEFNYQTTYFYETVLYELLGNSDLANVVFFSIPRLLFQPHKNILDCQKNVN